MFSGELEVEFFKTLFYMTKLHGYQPSELMEMSYIDFRIHVALLEQHLFEESQRYAMANQQSGF